MVNAGQAVDGYSAIFFMDGNQVARQMRLSEFGAFLDGYVGLSDLAETDVRAVLVNLNPDLTTRSLVFFRIWFDEEGRADSSWNVPIEAMAERGAKGPDLGGGPVSLVCRSQCPDPQFAEELWDPDMTPGNNHFQSIRKAVEANALRFQKVEPEDENIPVLQAADSESADNQESNSQDRIRVARVLREQRLRIKTLQSAHRESMVELQREHRLELQALRNEISELKQKYERLRVTNEQLKHRLARRNEQYLAMQEKLTPDEGGNDEQANASAETVLLREQLERKQRELELRDGKIQALEQENKEFQHQDPPENSLLDHLRQQAVFLVAYHPGVGHITLPYDDIDAYFNNPVAYAADRCGMNEPAYREWLSHYEQPVCNHVDANGNTCGEPIMRVTQPSEFRAGIDDRCDQHRPD
ncbi:MAG: DNA repair protein [Marinobacter sp.]|nr:DNA repair protein [Marinobacter sp.]